LMSGGTFHKRRSQVVSKRNSLLVECLDGRVLPSVSVPACNSAEVGTNVTVSNHYLIGLNDSVHSAGRVAKQLGRRYGLDVDAIFDAALHGFSAMAPSNRLPALAADPRVRFVEPDQRVADKLLSTGLDRVDGQQTGAVIPTDPMTGIASELANINVAVIDTGIDLKNPDLNVLGGVSFVGGNTTGQDDNGHGTGVASLIGAKADRANVTADQGITGVAPGIGLYSVKVLDRNGSGTVSSIVAGIDWVARNAATDHILFANMSLGGTGYSQAIHDAIARATAQGVTFLVAAGNESANAASSSPGGFDDTVITVSALADSDGQPGGLGARTQYGADESLASFSNNGSVVDITAPGVNIAMDRLGGGTWTASGTSMATPIATGTAALVVAADRRLSLAAGFDAQVPANRWAYVRSRLIATGTAPDNLVATNSGQQVYDGGQPGVNYVPVVTYVRAVYHHRIYLIPELTYHAVSSQGKWKNDPDGIPEPLVNAANAYAIG
jgi:subtilisin